MNDKIHQLNTRPDKVKGLSEELRRNLPTIIENVTMVAKLKKAQYDAYIQEGFTPEQAIELIKTL